MTNLRIFTVVLVLAACGKKSDDSAGSGSSAANAPTGTSMTASPTTGSSSASGATTGSSTTGSSTTGSSSASGSATGAAASTTPPPPVPPGFKVTPTDDTNGGHEHALELAMRRAMTKLSPPSQGSMELGVTLTQLRKGPKGMSCKIRILVTKQPSNDSMVMVNSGATVDTKTQLGTDDASATADCIDAVVEDLVSRQIKTALEGKHEVSGNAH